MLRGNNHKYELFVLGLWLLAFVPTYLIFKNSGYFTFLAPLYFVCMLGNVYIVRQTRGK